MTLTARPARFLYTAMVSVMVRPVSLERRFGAVRTMSNGIDCRPCAGFQLGRAILDGYRTWRDRRRGPTDYERIQGGETVNGWRTAIGGMVYQKILSDGYYDFVWPPPWMDDDPDEMDEKDSLMLRSLGTLPDGRQILTVARHSLVCPDVVSTLFQVVVGRGQQYDMVKCYYLNSSTVACIFENLPEPTIPVVLMDKITKLHGTLLLARPQRRIRPLTIWLDNAMENSLNMLYFFVGSLKLELHHIRYEIPVDDESLNETVIQPRSWQSIAVPRGNCRWACPHPDYNPPAIVLSPHAPFDEDPDLTDVSVLVFDRSLRTWRVVTPDQWEDMILEDNKN